jgi:predicted nucleic acid-binding protein
MTVGNRFAIDANILVYAIDMDAGAKREMAESLLINAATADSWLTVQSLSEYFHVVTRKNVASIEKAIRHVQTWQAVFNITAANVQSIYDAMAAVRDHGLSFWDAMQWATARQAGCACLITEDMQHGQRIGGVELLNPFLPESEDRIRRLLS